MDLSVKHDRRGENQGRWGMSRSRAATRGDDDWTCTLSNTLPVRQAACPATSSVDIKGNSVRAMHRSSRRRPVAVARCSPSSRNTETMTQDRVTLSPPRPRREPHSGQRCSVGSLGLRLVLHDKLGSGGLPTLPIRLDWRHKNPTPLSPRYFLTSWTMNPDDLFAREMIWIKKDNRRNRRGG